jgi:hypothetical protein
LGARCHRGGAEIYMIIFIQFLITSRVQRGITCHDCKKLSFRGSGGQSGGTKVRMTIFIQFLITYWVHRGITCCIKGILYEKITFWGRTSPLVGSFANLKPTCTSRAQTKHFSENQTQIHVAVLELCARINSRMPACGHANTTFWTLEPQRNYLSKCGFRKLVRHLEAHLRCWGHDQPRGRGRSQNRKNNFFCQLKLKESGALIIFLFVQVTDTEKRRFFFLCRQKFILQFFRIFSVS